MQSAVAIDVAWLWVSTALGLAAAAAAFIGWRRQRRRTHALERSLRAMGADPSRLGVLGDGLVTRAEFDNQLNACADRCRKKGKSLVVMLLNVDGFAAINESIGHRAGDAILDEIACRLHGASPKKVAATRMGGDEFVFLFENDLARAKTQADALLAALTEPLKVGDSRLTVTVSIGIAVYPLHGSRKRLLSQASTSMRMVKAAGGNAWAVFDAQAAVEANAQRALLADLSLAIKRQQLELFYQPKIDAATLQVTAAEALLRWHHPSHGMVSPSVFIPLAERHGLIDELGNWVIEEACRQAGLWRRAGLRMRVAINLSAFQMRQDGVVPRLEKALRRHELDPRRFTVEITESLALENTTATQRTFEGLRQAGLHVAIDDFGAGQTSLAYLRQLPVSELKMDMALVRDIVSCGDARVIAEAVVRLAHALQLRVVAEGVETAAQRDMLVKMGVDEMQGYMFARPMSARALGLWALDPEVPTHTGFRPSLYQSTTAA